MKRISIIFQGGSNMKLELEDDQAKKVINNFERRGSVRPPYCERGLIDSNGSFHYFFYIDIMALSIEDIVNKPVKKGAKKMNEEEVTTEESPVSDGSVTEEEKKVEEKPVE